MNISDIIQTSCAVIALIISVVSLVEANNQTRLSNKQALFDRQIKIYERMKSAGNLCAENLKQFSNTNEGHIKSYGYIASLLTNSTYFYEMYATFEDISSIEKKRVFWTKLGEIKEMAEQAKVLFPKEYARFINEYLLNYSYLLEWLYKYNFYVKKEASKTPPPDLENVLCDETFKTIDSKVCEYKEKLSTLQVSYQKQMEKLTNYLSIGKGR